MSRWNLSWLLGFVGVAGLSLSLAYFLPGLWANNLQNEHADVKLFVDVYKEVQQKYVQPLDAKKMRELVENMINSGLERLDPHSSFINAEEYIQFDNQSKGKFGGIGIQIALDRAGRIFVVSPIVGTPAYEAGILAGDYILKVNDKSTEELSMKKVVEMIQGEPGTKVKLSVLHEGAKKTVDLEIIRAEIAIDSVLGDRRMLNNLREWDFWIDPATKIAYVRIVAFTKTTTAELTKVVDALQKTGMRGLVIDLRGNPGGLLGAAVEVSSLFLEGGKRVVTTKSRKEREEVYNAKTPAGQKPALSYPIAILINRYSASASEIVAAALQDHLRAVIIGERSYGKGSVQNIILLEKDSKAGPSALKITTASYWRPSGRNIHRFPDSKDEDEWGVKPNKDFEVKLTDEERLEFMKNRRDRDIVRKPGQEPPKDKDKEKDKDKKKEPFKDRVLEKAVDYLKGELKKNAQGAAPANPNAGAVPPANPQPGNGVAVPAHPADGLDPVREVGCLDPREVLPPQIAPSGRPQVT